MKIFYSIIFFFLTTQCLSQQKDSRIFYIDSLPVDGVLLDKGWKFHPGDNQEWTKPEFDDSKWETIDPTLDLYYLPQIKKEPVGWFRIHLDIDSSLMNKPLAFQVYQSIASEIYLNGTLLQRYGIVSRVTDNIKAFQPCNVPIGLLFTASEQVLAVRFSVQKKLPYYPHVLGYPLFISHINRVSNTDELVRNFPVPDVRLLEIFEAGLFLILALFHFGYFITFKRQKANLYFGISAFAYSIGHLLFQFIFRSHSLNFRTYAALIQFFLQPSVYGLFLFIAIWQLFSRRQNIYFWLLIFYTILSIPIVLNFYEWGWFWGFLVHGLTCMSASLVIILKAWRKTYRDLGILVAGISLYLITFGVFILIIMGFLPNGLLFHNFYWADLLYHFSVMCVPVSLSIYLSREFAFTSKELEKKLSQVEQLSAEKQQILMSQKETLEQQVTERTSALKQSLSELKSTQAQLIQQEKMASLGELTAGIAHEIQNPLNFVNNFSEVNTELIDELKNELLTDNKEEAISIADDIKDNEQKILHHGKRADAIVKGMLQHSRASSGQKEPTDINALADEYLRLSYHGFRAKDKSSNAEIKTEFDETIGKINIVPQDIGRVLFNLFNNAFYAVTDKNIQQGEGYEPTVSVSTKKVNDKVEIKVKDNGNGIPQKVLDKIFQPFFTTKPTGQGTGLGLSLSYDIVKAHGGEIKVDTAEGEFTEFVIQLPIAV